ncbi:MAG: hypothetical protein HC811_13860 [Flammeovirgaceae bacterium]|nr:hypothetical protein [Flammeovirgaceae bacterium]
MLTGSLALMAQIDKDQLALQVSKADNANTEKLMEYIWKRHTDVTVNGQPKANAITEFSFDAEGKLQAKVEDATTTDKQMRGVRGRVQQNTQEENLEYVQSALELSLAYSYMSKGQLIDFFDKATVAEKNGVIEASGADVYVKVIN